MISEKLALSGGIFGWISAINDDLADFGFVIVGIFIGAWILSAAIYWLKGYDRIGAITEPATPPLG